jgi:multiple sugar transport system substrate-binding protein
MVNGKFQFWRITWRLTWALALGPLAGCAPSEPGETVHFWAMGREGEVVRQLIPEFEQRNPGVTVKVQQIPWSAAHEKLLTAYAGGVLPDVFQLGNTWLPEFVALHALEPLDGRLAGSGTADFFPGILETNRMDAVLYGLPWYVDTRVLFYRKDWLRRAGLAEPPRRWEDWLTAMERMKRRESGHFSILLPVNEWEMPVLLAWQMGGELLDKDARHGNFQSAEVKKAFALYFDLFRKNYAPALGVSQIANVYQEFANGYFSLYLSGPWNVGEFSKRLPPAMRDEWNTTPLPSFAGDAPGVSLAGGASLALSARSRHKEAAWRWIAFLAEPAIQARFYALTGDLPARASAWESPELAREPRIRAFREQLEQVRATPKIPEWERIAGKIAYHSERGIRGEATLEETLAALDRDAERILEKRRWLLGKQTDAP